ncbi:hypothetical protein PG990_011834 [Apiospora arundinis]
MAGFLSLPHEIRDQIYELSLVANELIDTRTHDGRWIDVFTCGIAIGLLLGNVFDLSFDESIASSIERMGNNVGYLRHVVIGFPIIDYVYPRHLEFEDRIPDVITLVNNHFSFLADSLSRCTKLTTITVSECHTPYPILWPFGFENNPQIIPEVLELANTRLRSISSLEKITIRMDTWIFDQLDKSLQSELEKLGRRITEVITVHDPEKCSGERPSGGGYGDPCYITCSGWCDFSSDEDDDF